MTIIIPEHWIQVACSITFWLCLSTLWAWLLTFAAVRIDAALKRRHSYWMAVVFLTTRYQRDKAEKYTLNQFRRLRDGLAKENPDFLKDIKDIFEL